MISEMLMLLLTPFREYSYSQATHFLVLVTPLSGEMLLRNSSFLAQRTFDGFGDRNTAGRNRLLVSRVDGGEVRSHWPISSRWSRSSWTIDGERRAELVSERFVE